jgi:hypothetical protein
MGFLDFIRMSGSLTKIVFAKHVFISVTFLLLLNGCATTETVSQKEINYRYANHTPEQALLSTTDKYNNAANEEYGYYSPQNWKLASEALKSANELAQKDKTNKEILKQIYLVDRRIDSAKYIKDRILQEFADLFEYKRILQKHNAPSSFGKQYEENSKSLASLIIDFENFTLGSSSEAESIRSINMNALKLLKSMQALNIKVVKHNYLSHDMLRMKQISAKDAHNIVPTSMQQAESALKSANEYIESYAHDQEGVKLAADKFNFSVSHLEHVFNEVIALSKLDSKKLEQIVLDQEHYLQQIGQALNGVDVRNLPLSIQAESVIKTAGNVLNHHTEKSTMIVELSEKNLLLEKQLKKHINKDDGSSAKLKSKIKLLELDILSLEEEREKLKEDLFALQQKNIDLAIQNAKLLADMEHKQGNFKDNDKQSLSDNSAAKDQSLGIIQTSKTEQSTRPKHAQLKP